MKLSDLQESTVNIFHGDKEVAHQVSRTDLRKAKEKLARKLKVPQNDLRVEPTHKLSEAEQRHVVFARHEDNEDVLAHNVSRHEAVNAVHNYIRDVNNASDASETIVKQVDDDSWRIGIPSSDYAIFITIEPVQPGNVYGSD